MATAEAAIGGMAHAHHEQQGFLRTYVFSTDHKIIAIQFLFASLFFLMVGALRTGNQPEMRSSIGCQSTSR